MSENHEHDKVNEELSHSFSTLVPETYAQGDFDDNKDNARTFVLTAREPSTNFRLSKSSECPVVSALPEINHDNTHIFDKDFTFNNDFSTSAYALRIALKNMKERYGRLQKKMSALEDENGRLVNSKSELFGELGKMQDSSIKLRERNLQLNHEVRTCHQECSSLKERFATISQENLKLMSDFLHSNNERKKLVRQVEVLKREKVQMKEHIERMLIQHQNSASVKTEVLAQLEDLFRSNFADSPASNATTLTDITSIGDAVSIDAGKTMLSFDDPSKDTETLSADAILKTKEMTRKMVMVLQKQKESLISLTPLLENILKDRHHQEKALSLNVDATYNSHFATCNSTINISALEDRPHPGISPPLNDSGGETNVLVEEKFESGRRSPFDWRKVQVADDDCTMRLPQTRTVSTSPDLTLTFDLIREKTETDPTQEAEESYDNEYRTCPMCNAIFHLVVPLEIFEAHVVGHFEVENGFEVVT